MSRSNFRVTFSLFTCGYAAHDAACPQAKDTAYVVLLRDLEFATVKAARAWADQDESDKVGEPVKAKFKACKCCRQVQS